MAIADFPPTFLFSFSHYLRILWQEVLSRVHLWAEPEVVPRKESVRYRFVSRKVWGRVFFKMDICWGVKQSKCGRIKLFQLEKRPSSKRAFKQRRVIQPWGCGAFFLSWPVTGCREVWGRALTWAEPALWPQGTPKERLKFRVIC